MLHPDYTVGSTRVLYKVSMCFRLTSNMDRSPYVSIYIYIRMYTGARSFPNP